VKKRVLHDAERLGTSSSGRRGFFLDDEDDEVVDERRTRSNATSDEQARVFTHRCGAFVVVAFASRKYRERLVSRGDESDELSRYFARFDAATPTAKSTDSRSEWGVSGKKARRFAEEFRAHGRGRTFV
tara:strand:- start:1854 stop:2240 length:387 start_codon:yes stop_codon:yes gene_type:complete